ncbi:MAG TPA: winged helix-turn-helix domain-containing protein [Pyrinomonadaceae bacterium]|nr:winged helix-turn-helix domain-containing protein [Pyrinomonadaceae bacterium]
MNPQQIFLRVVPEQSSCFEFGPFRLDVSERLLSRDGEPVPVTAKVFELLVLLIRNRGHALSKDDLMSKLWPDTIVEENNLTVNMSALRKALSDDSTHPQYIETVPRRGYRFVAEVKESHNGAVLPPKAIAAGILTETGIAINNAASNASYPGESSLKWIQRHRISFVVAVAVLFISLAGIIIFRLSRPQPPIESLAVLPFANGSTDPQAQYLSEGITESLVNKLSQLPGLRVKARSTMPRYQGREMNPQQAGRELGVQAVLTGSVAQRGNSLVVQAELVRVSDGAQIWGDHYNLEPTNVLVVQEEVARRIAEASNLKLTRVEQGYLARRETENIEAYNLYLKGRYYERRFTATEVQIGIDYFKKAIEKDPGYALAYTGLADSYVALGTYYTLPPAEAFAQARQAATRAVELDQSLAEAYVSMALVQYCYDWDWVDYEKNYRRARALNSSYAKNYYVHSQYLAATGRFDEAIAEAQRARELESPLDLETNLGWILYFAGRYDEAVQQYLRAVSLDPDLFRPHRLLGLTYLKENQADQAIAAIQRSVTLSGGSVEEKAYLCYVYGVTGHRAESLKVLREIEEQRVHKYISPYLMAVIEMGRGNKDQALNWLNQAYSARSVNLIYLMVEPIFEGLRSDARFAELVRRIGLPRDSQTAQLHLRSLDEFAHSLRVS